MPEEIKPLEPEHVEPVELDLEKDGKKIMVKGIHQWCLIALVALIGFMCVLIFTDVGFNTKYFQCSTSRASVDAPVEAAKK